MKFLRKQNLAYLYRLEQHHFPDYLEVIIQDKARPECCIYVDVLEDSALVAGFSEWFVEKSVASLVDYAQKKGWLKEREELYLRLDSRQVALVNRSLAQERAICAAFFSPNLSLMGRFGLGVFNNFNKFPKIWTVLCLLGFIFCTVLEGNKGDLAQIMVFCLCTGLWIWSESSFLCLLCIRL